MWKFQRLSLLNHVLYQLMKQFVPLTRQGFLCWWKKHSSAKPHSQDLRWDGCIDRQIDTHIQLTGLHCLLLHVDCMAYWCAAWPTCVPAGYKATVRLHSLLAGCIAYWCLMLPSTGKVRCLPNYMAYRQVLSAILSLNTNCSRLSLHLNWYSRSLLALFTAFSIPSSWPQSISSWTLSMLLCQHYALCL